MRPGPPRGEVAPASRSSVARAASALCAVGSRTSAVQLNAVSMPCAVHLPAIVAPRQCCCVLRRSRSRWPHDSAARHDDVITICQARVLGIPAARVSSRTCEIAFCSVSLAGRTAVSALARSSTKCFLAATEVLRTHATSTSCMPLPFVVMPSRMVVLLIHGAANTCSPAANARLTNCLIWAHLSYLIINLRGASAKLRGAPK